LLSIRLNMSFSCYNLGSPKTSDSEEEEEDEDEEEVPPPRKHSKAPVVTSPPESEGETEPESDTPVTPRPRFSNRKRVLTSDSEANEAAGQGSPRKKTRAGRRGTSSKTEVESNSGLFTMFVYVHLRLIIRPLLLLRRFHGHFRRKSSHLTKGKRRKAQVNGHSEEPSTLTKARYADHRGKCS
jgi:hypothetical protein